VCCVVLIDLFYGMETRVFWGFPRKQHTLSFRSSWMFLLSISFSKSKEIKIKQINQNVF
jgi:hypothetical protein